MLTTQQQLSELLEHAARLLDIPDELHEEAVRRYEQVGHWIEEHDLASGRREPSIYPQGSFRLGTVTRPISDEGEYDIDLVYERDLRKNGVSQEQLKKQSGEILRSFVDHCQESHDDVPELIESRRCWRLDYSERFHLDVLPAIPDDEGRQGWADNAESKILITDSDLHEWQHSNPIGYAEWFKGRMAVRLQAARAALASHTKAAAEDVPDYKVKTPLQRAIQILKRHRDIHFQNDEDQPISIIITTLAARAYDNEEDLLDSLLNLVRDMPKHIETREKDGKLVSWVSNPVNDDENFADKWEDNPQREIKFRSWLRKVNDDLSAAIGASDVSKSANLLRGSLGSRLVANAAIEVGIKVVDGTPSGQQRSQRPTSSLSLPHCQPVPWLQNLSCNVTLKCGVHRQNGSAKEIFPLTDRPVPKNLRLRFEITTDARQPYEIHWQVVNTGEEAERANGLRGRFDDDSLQTGPVRWEHTAYAGTHWVEVFIVRNQICVARSGPCFVAVES